MKVSELINHLKTLPHDADVMLDNSVGTWNMSKKDFKIDKNWNILYIG